MKGTVKEAVEGAQGFDTAAPLSASTCAALVDAGMQFVIRYVSRLEPESRDLSRVELQTILDAGLALMVAQHVRKPGWTPSVALGAADGHRAVENTHAAGVPSGVCLWCDLEGIDGTSGGTIAYANAWTKAVQAGGYDPGVYVGFGVPLTGQQLYKNLIVRRYWRSFSRVPDVMTRGYQMVQKGERRVAGVRVDPDVIQTDHKGDRPVWLEPTLVEEPVAVS